MLIEYKSNNSGGNWWLSDKNWHDLEAAGWYVEWGGKFFCAPSHEKIPEGKEDCGLGEECPGHRKAENDEEAEDVRWLGGLACTATKEFVDVKGGLQEFERITGLDISDAGCNCCGAPHIFSWEGGCSGEDCLQYLYDVVPTSLRDATERLNK